MARKSHSINESPNQIHGIGLIQSSNPPENLVGAHGRAPARRPASNPTRNNDRPPQPTKQKLWDTPEKSVGVHGRRAPLPRTSQRNVGVAYRKPRPLSSFVAGFKSATTQRINQRRDAPGTPVWQRNYYDRIIRDDRTFQNIRRYIQNNPSSWDVDQLRSDHSSKW